LRDHLRLETERIRRLEIRSRGLRLYAAWSMWPELSSPIQQGQIIYEGVPFAESSFNHQTRAGRVPSIILVTD
jgi:hypothetical protein